MAIASFLAMTGAEIQCSGELPQKIAWLGCHFSQSGKGLSNIPRWLPGGSLLILEDSSPIDGHDPRLVCQQLEEIVSQWECAGVLLDFQREPPEGEKEMAAAIVSALPCPVAVSALYGADLDCPVFLPPISVSTPIEEALAPWKGRECWLELALDGECITVTQTGAAVSDLVRIPGEGFPEEALHCHYSLELGENQAKWALWRTREDVAALLEAAESLGVTTAVGLWQELG